MPSLFLSLILPSKLCSKTKKHNFIIFSKNEENLIVLHRKISKHTSTDFGKEIITYIYSQKYAQKFLQVLQKNKQIICFYIGKFQNTLTQFLRTMEKLL